MPGTLITSTPRGDLHPLAYQGIFVSECHSQLTEQLRSHFGEPYVLLFAEPIPDDSREAVDWYSPVQGRTRSLSSLDPEQQNAVRAHIGALAADILAHAAQLMQSGIPQRMLAGNILKRALQYPDDSFLFVVGEQPVVTGWGFGPKTVGAMPQDLSRLAPLRVPTTLPPAAVPSAVEPEVLPQPPIVPVRGWRLWPWLLPLLLLLALLALLFVGWPGMAPLFSLPGLSFGLDAAPDVALRTEQDREQALRTEIDDLHRQLEQYQSTCVEPSQGLTLPETPGKDMSFLEGVWRCDTGLYDDGHNEVAMEYAFDVQGKGEVRVESDGGTCTSPAWGIMQEDGTLVIDTEEVIVCPNGHRFSGQEVRCVRHGERTECTGRNKSKAGSTWQGKFHRK
ncbi:MAG: hypothetical protein AB7D57_11120 [Desulfovibrionaceae bacterium]